jgi:hypothetical protein
MVRRRWIFFGPRIERERNIDEYLEEIRRTPSTVGDENSKRSLKPGWKLDTPVPTDPESTEDDGDTKPGRHHANRIAAVAPDWHPLWSELDDTAKALWNLRFMGHARYTVPLGRLAVWCRKAYKDELSNWEWLNVDFIDWPEEWRTNG